MSPMMMYLKRYLQIACKGLNTSSMKLQAHTMGSFNRLTVGEQGGRELRCTHAYDIVCAPRDQKTARNFLTSLLLVFTFASRPF